MDLQLPKQRMHDQFRARILDKHECRTFYFATLDPPSASRGLLWDIDDVFARRRIELARRALRERHFSRGRNSGRCSTLHATPFLTCHLLAPRGAPCPPDANAYLA